MITEQWQLGLLAGLFAVHLLAVGLAYRRGVRRSRSSTVESVHERGLIDREEGVVKCPNCATENELGYRYCRSCVGELPVSMGFDGAGNSPLGRITR